MDIPAATAPRSSQAYMFLQNLEEDEAVLTVYGRTSDIGECRIERDLQCK